MCCAFALWFDSLASVTTSVGAKPNHGFFNCQHPRVNFFTPGSRRPPSAKPASTRRHHAPTSSRRIASTDRISQNYFFSVVSCATHVIVVVTDISSKQCRRHARDGAKKVYRTCPMPCRRRRISGTAPDDLRKTAQNFRRLHPVANPPRDRFAKCSDAIATRRRRRRTRVSDRPRRTRNGIAEDVVHTASTRRRRRRRQFGTPKTPPAAHGGRWRMSNEMESNRVCIPGPARTTQCSSSSISSA